MTPAQTRRQLQRYTGFDLSRTKDGHLHKSEVYRKRDREVWQQLRSLAVRAHYAMPEAERPPWNLYFRAYLIKHFGVAHRAALKARAHSNRVASAAALARLEADITKTDFSGLEDFMER